MSNIFSTLQVYAGKWSVKSTRKFNEEELNFIEEEVGVEPSRFGLSCRFTLKQGGQTYIPCTPDKFEEGEIVALSKLKLVTLEKDGENDIIRVDK